MRLGIVTSGGGTACAYSAGGLHALAVEMGITQPYCCVGSSGSAGTLAYFVAGQFNSIANIWCELLATKKFINIKRLHRIIDIDYLIDEVFKKQDPLNIEAIKKSSIIFNIAVTDALKRVKYFSNEDSVDMF